MGRMGYGYGSEWQLLRFMGRHRSVFTDAVKTTVDPDGTRQVTSVDWLDHPFNTNADFGDGEIKSVDFLADYGGEEWKQYWPDSRPGEVNRAGVPSWDAVGRIAIQGQGSEWLLVEAKAHEGEFTAGAECGARGESLKKIEAALDSCREAMGIDPNKTPLQSVAKAWLGRYYQVANRLAVLHFLLNKVNQPARLLFVYFLGDSQQNQNCPKEAQEWRTIIKSAYQNKLHIPLDHLFAKRVHYLFVDVASGKYSSGL
ncbi:MAG: hypothetical protein GYA33_09990 [Thermogutta sp.]|nr:hypothetical protein [Thermogutta sp.]